jgi:hemoglobin-like flavoprotein
MPGINVALIQQTWDKVTPIADDAAKLFYDRLFELDPALRPMFAHSDMKEQRKKLMQMIGFAVRSLSNMEELIPAVRGLGKRHVGYGVQDHHYDTVGAALIWTLEQGLGDAFTAEARESWTMVYGTLAAVMKSASHSIAA